MVLPALIFKSLKVGHQFMIQSVVSNQILFSVFHAAVIYQPSLSILIVDVAGVMVTDSQSSCTINDAHSQVQLPIITVGR
jgi:hypothetical protein